MTPPPQENAETLSAPATELSTEWRRAHGRAPPKPCPACMTYVELRDGTTSCIHSMKHRGFTQHRDRWAHPDGTHHHITWFLMPGWMFPNTRKTVEEDYVDEELFSEIRDVANELHNPVDPAIDDDNHSDASSGGGFHGFVTS